MKRSIEPILYADPQQRRPHCRCSRCGGECYAPSFVCSRCERRKP